VVLKGSGSFVVGGRTLPFADGDVLLVPAKVPHRFEDFSDDLVVWALFYGPPGGEIEGDPRKEIERANTEFRAAFRRRDAEAVAGLYTEYPSGEPRPGVSVIFSSRSTSPDRAVR
jgi:uncharacterized protein YjlB